MELTNEIKETILEYLEKAKADKDLNATDLKFEKLQRCGFGSMNDRFYFITGKTGTLNFKFKKRFQVKEFKLDEVRFKFKPKPIKYYVKKGEVNGK